MTLEKRYGCCNGRCKQTVSPCKHPISALSCIPIVATPYILGFERTNGYNGTNRARTTLMAPAAPQKSIFQTY